MADHIAGAGKMIRWELADAPWGTAGEHKRNFLLAAGWEPFAVAGCAIWFRRQVAA